MRIAAIFNVWADTADLLPYAVENIRPVVDDIIIVWSRKSNRGQVVEYELPKNCILVQCEPTGPTPHVSEIAKRNAGLKKAKELGFSHFIMLDGDEMYLRDEFQKEKEAIYNSGYAGSVCRIQTYFKSPTLTIGIDHTLVPFIHKITPKLEYKLNYAHYPYTYDNGAARIDCTRRLNINSGVKLLDITMFHFSYVRKDMSLKLQNSSANFKAPRAEIIYNDLKNAKPGYFCKGYQRELVSCENIFNLPEYE